jgi:alpha-mannosidase
VVAAVESDLLERPLPGTAVSGPGPDGAVTLTLRPFQIVTVRLRRG